jgi:hypothetical protein
MFKLQIPQLPLFQQRERRFQTPREPLNRNSPISYFSKPPTLKENPEVFLNSLISQIDTKKEISKQSDNFIKLIESETETKTDLNKLQNEIKTIVGQIAQESLYGNRQIYDLNAKIEDIQRVGIPTIIETIRRKRQPATTLAEELVVSYKEPKTVKPKQQQSPQQVELGQTRQQKIMELQRQSLLRAKIEGTPELLELERRSEQQKQKQPITQPTGLTPQQQTDILKLKEQTDLLKLQKEQEEQQQKALMKLSKAEKRQLQKAEAVETVVRGLEEVEAVKSKRVLTPEHKRKMQEGRQRAKEEREKAKNK